MEGMDALCAVLGDEARLCGDLTRVLRAEQQAVVALRSEAVFACLAERQSLAAALGGLAERRRALVRDLAGRHGGDTDSAGALLGRLGDVERDRLAGGLRALRRALLEARALERQNARLAQASLETTHEILRALATLVPGTRYDAEARLAPAPAERVGRRA